MNRKIKAAACVAALVTVTGALSISQAVGQPDRFDLGLGRYDHFKPDPRRAANPDPDAFPKMTECRQEDSRECGWDAVHMGDGFGTSFVAPPAGIDRVYYNHLPVHYWLYGSWSPAPGSKVGTRVDLINGGSRLIGDQTIRHVGDTTTWWVWPGQDRIDYQVGTS